MKPPAAVSVLAVDPGCEVSAWCLCADGLVCMLRREPNSTVAEYLATSWADGTVLAIEDMESFGMPVGREVFRTVRWSGRFIERWRGERPVLVPRRLVKLTLCGSTRAKDANVRQAVIDALGEPPTKARPNPNYPRRPSKDEWSAIAIALTYQSLVREGRELELEEVR